MKIRFYLNDRAERVMALWSESRGEYLAADSVLADVDACICGETGACGEEMKRIAAFLDSAAAKAVNPEWMIDTALPCSEIAFRHYFLQRCRFVSARLRQAGL